MSSPAVLAPAEATLEQMAHSYFLGGRHTRYPVVRDGHVIGLVDLSRLKAVPREQWSKTSVADVAARDLAGVVASPHTPVDRVLSLLGPDGPGAVLVVDGGRLAGIVTRADVIRLIQESSHHV
jgi:CBS domain-containing protein